jgi:hypothetical protein
VRTASVIDAYRDLQASRRSLANGRARFPRWITERASGGAARHACSSSRLRSPCYRFEAKRGSGGQSTAPDSG